MTGWMADAFGGRSPFYIGGVISVLAAAVCAIVLIRRGGVSLPVRRFGLRILTRDRL